MSDCGPKKLYYLCRSSLIISCAMTYAPISDWPPPRVAVSAALAPSSPSSCWDRLRGIGLAASLDDLSSHLASSNLPFLHQLPASSFVLGGRVRRTDKAALTRA